MPGMTSTWKLVGLRGLAGLRSFVLAYFILSQWYCNTLERHTQLISSCECNSSSEENSNNTDGANVWNEINRVIELERMIIRNEMINYPYPNGKYNKTARKLEDLLIEENGKPMRSIIVTTWRCGSTFFGDVINAYPANFYHYEPLVDYDLVQIRGPPLSANALTRVKSLLNCDFTESGDYIKYGKNNAWVFDTNKHLWKQCEAHEGLCDEHEYFSAMCRLFPFQSMKLVRLRLNIAQELLADEDLAVRMVLLIRDPRGIMQSRKHRDWCPGSRDCSDQALLCADLAADYKVAVKLQRKYPNTFRVLRYEDLSTKPYETIREISEFYGLGFHPEMKQLLHNRTKPDGQGGSNSTSRVSAVDPYHWRGDLTYEEVDEIQQNCLVAMKYWGYVPAVNATHQKHFIPIKDYVLN